MVTVYYCDVGSDCSLIFMMNEAITNYIIIIIAGAIAGLHFHIFHGSISWRFHGDFMI